jgi:amidase
MTRPDPTQLTYLDMRLFVTAVLAEEPWKYDSKVIPMPWRQSEEEAIKTKISSGRLTLAYYNCDGNVSLHDKQ